MPDHLHDDDSLAEALADAWIERAMVDENLRRLALRAAGLAKEPADMTHEELARHHGTSRRSLLRIEANLLQRFRLDPECQRILREMYPSASDF
jgi:hypothetical protein